MIMYVGVTGNALPEDIARFVAHGADEVVLKPLTKSKLLDAIARYMQLTDGRPYLSVNAMGKGI